MIFTWAIDLEKAYDRVSREIILWVLEKKGVSSRYINTVKDMYYGRITSVSTTGGETGKFLIKVGLHQGSALSLSLALAMYELTQHIQEVPWCMLFANNTVLIDKTREGVMFKLELWI